MAPQVSYYWAAVERIDPTVEGKDSVVGSVLIKRNIYCTVREIRYFLDSIKRNNLKSQVVLDLFASVSKVSHSLRVEASTVEGSTPREPRNRVSASKHSGFYNHVCQPFDLQILLDN